MKLPIPSCILQALIHPSRDNSLKAQVARQFLAGFLTTALDVLTFNLCVVSGLHPMIAAVVSFSLAVLTNFTLTRYYVFGEVRRQKKKTVVQLIIYVLVCFVSLGIVQVFLLFFHFRLGLDPVLVKIISVPVVFIWTVLSGRFIIFDKK
jgi:putative flippase GtrA